jgi:G3E family GTPase
MTATIDVYLITGFLGSGKTTLLNHLTQAFDPDLSIMILMNEFGEVSIDGQLVDGDDLDMVEISKGSIFCVCVKTDFIKTLLQIANHKQPDILIIEATGIADPTALQKDLNLSLFDQRFVLKAQYCLIDAVHFEDAYDTFNSVEKQLASATLFVINKTDQASTTGIERVRAIITRHHPSPTVVETTHAAIPSQHLPPPRPRPPATSVDAQQPSAKPSPNEVERTLEALVADPDGAAQPPDRLLSMTCIWRGKHSDDFRQLIASLPAGVVRAKGFVHLDRQLFLFNWVMGTTELSRVTADGITRTLWNRLVFIASEQGMDALGRLLAAKADLIRRFVPLDPMRPML